MKNKAFFIKNWIKICIAVGILFFTVVGVNFLQDRVSEANQYNESIKSLQNFSDTWSANETTASELTEAYHKGNHDILNDLKELMQSSSVTGSLQSSTTTSSGKNAKTVVANGTDSLDGLDDENFAPYLFVIDAQGNVAFSADQSQIGTNLCSTGFFTKDELAQVLTSPDDGVLCNPQQADNDYCFYATSLETADPEYYLVMGFTNDLLQERLISLESLDTVVSDASLSEGAFILEINPQSGVINYCSNDSLGLSGKTVDEAGIPDSLLGDCGSATVALGGADYICASVVHNCDSVAHTNGAILVEALSASVRFADNYKPTVWAIVFLVMTLIIAVHYALLLPRELAKDHKKQKVVYFFHSKFAINLTAAAKAVPLMILGLVLIFGGVFYCRTILKLSYVMNDVSRPLTQLASQLDNSEQEKEDIDSYCNQMFLSKTQMIGIMVGTNSSCLNEATTKTYVEYTQSGEKKAITDNEGNPLRSVSNSAYLQNLCDSNDLVRIQIFNDLGYVIASSDDNWSFQLSHDSAEQSSAFYDVIDGKMDYLVQSEQSDDEGEDSQYTGVAFNYYTTKDVNGSTLYVTRSDYQNYLDGNWSGNPITAHRGVLQCSANTTIRQSLLKSLDIDYIMENINLQNDAYMVVFDNSSDHKIVYTPNKQNMGKTAKELDVTDEEFSGSFNGFQTVNGVEYYECCRYIDGYYVAVATPTPSLYANRLASVLRATLACLVAMILIMTMFLVVSKEDMLWLMRKDGGKPSAKEDVSAIDDDRESPGVFARWRQGLDRMSAKDKITYMIRILGLLFGIYFLLGYLFGGLLFADSAVIDYVFSGGWELGVNIFAFSKALVVLVSVLVAVSILTWFVKMVCSVFSSNAATIANFLMSLLRYICVIAAAFYCMYLFGMDSMSLLASAGIISLIIGLGAQSLISDMLASVFIIFEGYYHVGDFVTIDNEYGQVVEIGIRSTKVRFQNNTIGIYNNSTIKDVVNMSVKEARVRMMFNISYDESLERVEEILRQELPKFVKKIPEIHEAPVYLGVPKKDDSSMYLLVVAKCKGADYKKVTRAMNVELEHMRAKYEIASSNVYSVDVKETRRIPSGEPGDVAPTP